MNTFSLGGFATVLKRSQFELYFLNSLTVTLVRMIKNMALAMVAPMVGLPTWMAPGRRRSSG